MSAEISPTAAQLYKNCIRKGPRYTNDDEGQDTEVPAQFLRYGHLHSVRDCL